MSHISKLPREAWTDTWSMMAAAVGHGVFGIAECTGGRGKTVGKSSRVWTATVGADVDPWLRELRGSVAGGASLETLPRLRALHSDEEVETVMGARAVSEDLLRQGLGVRHPGRIGIGTWEVYVDRNLYKYSLDGGIHARLMADGYAGRWLLPLVPKEGPGLMASDTSIRWRFPPRTSDQKIWNFIIDKFRRAFVEGIDALVESKRTEIAESEARDRLRQQRKERKEEEMKKMLNWMKLNVNPEFHAEFERSLRS